MKRVKVTIEISDEVYERLVAGCARMERQLERDGMHGIGPVTISSLMETMVVMGLEVWDREESQRIAGGR